MENKPSCQSCQFFTKPAANSTAYGDCVRYPTPVTHTETFWCGEYKPRSEQQFKEPAKRKT